MAEPLEVESHDDIALVRTAEDVDIANADLLREGCLAAMTNDCVGLVLDLSRSDYLDSAGIRALFTIAERLEPHRQRLALVVPPDAHMRRVLRIVDIESSVDVHETIEAAFERLRGPARGPADGSTG